MADAPTTGTVIVALPAADHTVHSIGAEQKHATLCFLGDDIPPERVTAVRQAVADHVETVAPFTEKVSAVKSLGDKGARVWMMDGTGGLSDLHADLAARPEIAPLMAKADQFPSYTPHVTIDYTVEGKTKLADQAEKAAQSVDRIPFDRLAVWSGQDQTEYALKSSTQEEGEVTFDIDWLPQLTEEQMAEAFGLPVSEVITSAQGAAGTERLMTYWAEGEGAAKIRWGEKDDFYRCVDHLGKYVADPKGLCSNLHKRALGVRPGQESAEEAPVSDLQLVETVTITEAAAAQARETGEFPIQFISPGWGSSGYYSPKVVQDAAHERVIPAGTHMYADHPTDAEAKARPARSIKDLMAVTIEDARLSESGALVGRAKVVPAWQPFVEAVRSHIGVSIRGDAKDIREGTAEGRRGRIIEGLAHVQSVDFVTRAGRGGKVLELLESAVTAGVEIREDLDVALVEAKYDAEQLRKMADKGHAMKNPKGDPSYPIADETDLRNAIHAVGRGSGDHTAIRAHIKKRAKDLGCSSLIPDDWPTTSTSESGVEPTDVPAGRPGDTKEAHMGMKEIEESEFNRLTETAGRVTTLETALTKAQGDLTEARAALLPNKDLRERLAAVMTENAMLRAREVAVPLIAEALEDALIGEAARKRIAAEILDGIVVKEGDEGQRMLDTAGLTEAINTKVRVAEAEAQELREAMGMGAPGQPRGLGRPGGGLLVEQKLGEYTDTTADAIGRAFGLSEASAKTAATGR